MPSGDMPSSLRAEKERHARDVLWSAETSEHSLLSGSVEDLGGDPICEASRPDVPGRYGVHIDVARTQLDRGARGQADEPRLGRRVVRNPELRSEAVHRGHVHDFSVPPLGLPSP